MYQKNPGSEITAPPRYMKSSPGRKYARVRICLQTQTSCVMETDMDDMDDC